MIKSNGLLRILFGMQGGHHQCSQRDLISGGRVGLIRNDGVVNLRAGSIKETVVGEIVFARCQRAQCGLQSRIQENDVDRVRLRLCQRPVGKQSREDVLNLEVADLSIVRNVEFLERESWAKSIRKAGLGNLVHLRVIVNHGEQATQPGFARPQRWIGPTAAEKDAVLLQVSDTCAWFSQADQWAGRRQHQIRAAAVLVGNGFFALFRSLLRPGLLRTRSVSCQYEHHEDERFEFHLIILARRYYGVVAFKAKSSTTNEVLRLESSTPTK